jgi:signal transduction histidine kinase/CheY-like chemotaxis protein
MRLLPPLRFAPLGIALLLALSSACVPTSAQPFGVLIGLAAAITIAWVFYRAEQLEKTAAVATTRLANITLRDDAAVKFNEVDLPDKVSILEAALNHMSQGFAMILPDGKIWAYNRKAVEFSGVSEDTFTFPATAREIFEAQLASGELGKSGELLPTELREYLLHGTGRPPSSYIRRRPNGQIIEVRSGPMPGGGTVQSYTDVTDLMNAKDAAEQAAKAKAAFVATMSHEIRTPLNGVIGMAEIMRRSELSDQQAEQLTVISECGSALLSIVNDILDFSKLESGKIELESAVFDLKSLCENSIKMVQPAAGGKALELQIAYDQSCPRHVLGDVTRIRQVLLNLLSNAIKFTSSGSVVMRVCDAGGSRVRFEVVDTGIGIDPSLRSRVFQDFSQLDSSTARRFGGTGLGLAISKRLVTYMGGLIDFESVPGEGSRFWFEIPLTEGEAAPVVPNDAPSAAASLSVLVVDDSRVNRMVARQMLNLLSHKAALAESGLEALNMVQAERYDLILMDMQMREMDGVAATQAIRGLSSPTRLIPIVAMTANWAPSDEQLCKDAGMNDFLSKPFTLEQLRGVLDRVRRVIGAGQALPVEAPETALSESLLRHLGPEGYMDVLVTVEAEMIGLLARFEAAAKRGDQAALARVSDALVESCAAVGLSETARLCRATVPSPDERSLAAELAQVRETLETDMRSLRARVRPMSSAVH